MSMPKLHKLSKLTKQKKTIFLSVHQPAIKNQIPNTEFQCFQLFQFEKKTLADILYLVICT